MSISKAIGGIFLQILPTVAFLFSLGLTTWIPQTIYCYFWAYPFFYFLVVGSVR